ncbi:MAG: ABC transporter permease [Eubacteriaceae bacterium]|jgi:peptide/nickel transport system permease protein|nr:ABC transporter permease [Eubacteriaceae bacterium]
MRENAVGKQAAPSKKAGRESFKKFARRFCRNRLSLAGLLVLAAIVAASVAAPLIAPYDPLEIFMDAFQAPPSPEHILGTDSVGRDVFSRLLYAGSVSMSVSLIAVSIYSVVGILIGAASGYFGGKFDYIVMRATDTVMSFPLMVLMIVLVAIMGQSVANIVLIIAFVGWPSLARMVRSEILSLKGQEFVEAAVASGEGPASIIFRYLVPNCMPAIIVNVTFGIANAILMEASLSFLGLGIQPPAASWGYMLMDAQSVTILTRMPWLWLPPGLIIFVTVMAINFIGDGLRDALDPKMKI